MSELLNQAIIDYWESLIVYIQENGLPPVHDETYIIAHPEIYEALQEFMDKMTVDDLREMYKQDEEQ